MWIGEEFCKRKRGGLSEVKDGKVEKGIFLVIG